MVMANSLAKFLARLDALGGSLEVCSAPRVWLGGEGTRADRRGGGAMSGARRAPLPWVLWAAAMVMLVAPITRLIAGTIPGEGTA